MANENNKPTYYTKKAYLTPEEQAELQLEINKIKNRMEANKRKGNAHKKALAKNLRIYTALLLFILGGLFLFFLKGGQLPSPLLP
jgi:hypothetical protein